jgi:hypothetical protein
VIGGLTEVLEAIPTRRWGIIIRRLTVITFETIGLRRSSPSSLKMEAVCSSETLVSIQVRTAL